MNHLNTKVVSVFGDLASENLCTLYSVEKISDRAEPVAATQISDRTTAVPGSLTENFNSIRIYDLYHYLYLSISSNQRCSKYGVDYVSNIVQSFESSLFMSCSSRNMF